MSGHTFTLNQRCCFRIYRSASLFSRWLRRMGAWGLADFVFWILPLKLCRTGYEVWERCYAEGFEAFLRGGAE